MHIVKSITLGRIASVLSDYLTKIVLFAAFFFIPHWLGLELTEIECWD